MRAITVTLTCVGLVACGGADWQAEDNSYKSGKADLTGQTSHSAAGIRAAFRTALDDGSLEVEEASDITSALAEGAISPSAEGQLRMLVEANQDRMTPEASQHLKAFLTDQLPKLWLQAVALGSGSRGSIEDPKMLSKHQGLYEYRGLDGHLFVNGITGDDVLQGHIADCYLVAALSAVAYAHPETIENAFRVNEDRTVTVTLYLQPYFGADFEPYDFTIDSDLVMDGGTPLYARSRDTGELWVPLMEKALVMLKALQSELETANYDSIGYGDLAGKIISAITGHDYSGVVMKMASAETLFDRVNSATRDGKAVAFRTYPSGRRIYQEPRIHNDHSYSMLGTVVVNGVKYLRLRNPWGFEEPGEDGNDDGIFLMTPAKAKDLFMSAFLED